MKLLAALTLRSPQNSAELTQLGIAELIVQAMKVHSSDDKHQVISKNCSFLRNNVYKMKTINFFSAQI